MERNRRDRELTLKMGIICGALFAVFCYGFLYVMQSDLMAAAQHVLSQGKTVYSPFWGASTVTLLLSALPFFIGYRVAVPTWATALFYFPSCLCLALLTSVGFSADGTCVAGAGWWSLPAVLLYAVVLKVLAQIPETHGKKNLFSRLWPNALLMALFFGMVGSCATTDVRLHHELQAARCLQAGDYEAALSVGKQSAEVSRRLTAMRCYALARTGRLGERLFDYPMPYGSCGLLPSGADSVGLAHWPGAFYRHIGARPSARLEDKATQFFRVLAERHDTTQIGADRGDYLLCAYLLDKNIDAFVRALPAYYAIDDSLPRSYKEALVLYTHVRMHPVLTYENSVLQANYGEYQAQRRKPVSDAERYKTCRRLYGTTYWFYYHFQ